MGLRSSLTALLSNPAGRLLDGDLHDRIQDALAALPLARASDVEQLREELAELRAQRGAPEADDRVAALEERVASLEKRLNMAMGAVQAATAKLMELQQASEQAQAAASRALQRATSASAAAESATDGVSALEARLEELDAISAPDELAVDPATELSAPAPQPESSELSCRVPGCPNKHRARGFCGRHYQQYRRSTLEGFVGPDGALPLDGEVHQVDPALAGRHARRVNGEIVFDAP